SRGRWRRRAWSLRAGDQPHAQAQIELHARDRGRRPRSQCSPGRIPPHIARCDRALRGRMSDAVRAVYHIDALWTCTTHALREDSPPVEADGCTDVVGEFRFDAPVAPIDLVRLDQSCAWCFEM